MAESDEDRLEHRIDGTDAFDTLFVEMIYGYEGSVRGVGMGRVEGVR